MKKLLALTVGMLFLGSCALATWDDANSRGLFPYWQTGNNWYTLLTFVNTSEETSDVIQVRFLDVHGPPCSDTTSDMFAIRQREMLIISTTPSVPIWYPVSAGYGFIKFRVQAGGFIQVFCCIYNQVNGSGYIVPAYHQDSGF